MHVRNWFGFMAAGTNTRLCALNRQLDDRIMKIEWVPSTRTLILVSHFIKSRSLDIKCFTIDIE